MTARNEPSVAAAHPPRAPARPAHAPVDGTGATPHTTPIPQRILDAFPSGSYSLAALLRLMDIVESEQVPTAAVECRAQPRLLVNPRFVERHAPTAEKLLVLVMHELHHVLLGHTTLFPRVTPAQNFVFDAVINALVCRMFPGAEHVGFFTDYYSADAFPECLLRPPPGWPARGTVAPAIDRLPAPLRERTGHVHRALYSEVGATYKEVFDTLPRLLVEGGILDVPLLGDHASPGEAPSLEARSPILLDVVREIVEQWPQPPDPIRGRSHADLVRSTTVAVRRPPTARAVLRSLIRRVAGERGAGRRLRAGVVERQAVGAVPTLARRSLVQRALGFEPLLHPAAAATHARRREGERVHVYLDVSGSMAALRSALYGAVLDCAPLVEPTVHLFSSRVVDASLAELQAGACRSTEGTDIACVAEHMHAHRVRRALLITDGWVGRPRGHHRDILARARLAVAWSGENVNRNDLIDVADCHDSLPIGAQP
jgi:hypothetical protein